MKAVPLRAPKESDIYFRFEPPASPNRRNNLHVSTVNLLPQHYDDLSFFPPARSPARTDSVQIATRRSAHLSMSNRAPWKAFPASPRRRLKPGSSMRRPSAEASPSTSPGL